MILSICIPSYNRANELTKLIDSIITQKNHTLQIEIVICDDLSPQRAEIINALKSYIDKYPSLVRYYDNQTNLGYDANLRKTIHFSKGDFCLLMGNDDLVADNALSVIESILSRHPDLGVILRSYATFSGDQKNITENFKYFGGERKFSPGVKTSAVLFRKSVVISGLVIRRDKAVALSTNKFDGSLLYQLYLVSCIASVSSSVFTPENIALYRLGGTPEFGNAACERASYIPRKQTVESSFAFVYGMLQLAKEVEKIIGKPFYKMVKADIAIYSYPFLRIQMNNGICDCTLMYVKLFKLGFWKYPHFSLYFLSLIIFGKNFSDGLIRRVKCIIGYTPSLHFFKIVR